MAARHPPGRAAPADQRAAGPDVAGGPAAGAALLCRPVQPGDPPVRGPEPDARGPDRMGAGQRAPRGHVDLRAGAVRQLLRGVLVRLARPGHPGPDAGRGDPRRPAHGRHTMTAPGRTRRAAAQNAPADRLALGRVPMILMYHAVADIPWDPNQLGVTPARFAQQMDTLHRLGLRGVGIGTLVDAMRAGRQRGLVGITFDDGYVSVLEAAVPELLRHGFTGTFFVISGRLGGTNDWDEGTPWPLVSPSQVRELASAGMEIGAHGATHIRLAGLDGGQLHAEIGGGRARPGGAHRGAGRRRARPPRL